MLTTCDPDGAGRPSVTHVLGGAGIGGTEKQLLLLLPELARSTDARVVLLRDGPLRPEFEAVAPTLTLHKRGKVDPVVLGRLVARIRAQRPDIVHTWGSTANLWGGLAAHLAGSPRLVVSDRSLDHWKGRLLRLGDTWVYGWADAVVGNSAAVTAASVGRGARQQSTRVLANAVAAGPEAAPSAATHNAGDAVAPLVLFLGRLHPDKGPDLLVEAFRTLQADGVDFRAVLAGPAEQPAERALRGEVLRRIEEAGLGHVVAVQGATDSPRRLLRTATVVVVPSRVEGVPNVALEAMAEGVPVVAFDVGGVADVVDETTGWLVPSGDLRALATAIASALAAPGERSRRAAVARARVHGRNGVVRVAADWVGLYGEILGAERSVPTDTTEVPTCAG